MEKIVEVKNLELSFHTFAGEVKAIQVLILKCIKGKHSLLLVSQVRVNRLRQNQLCVSCRNHSTEFKNGEILFGGKDLLKLSEKEMQKVRGKDISMIFQDPMTSLNPTMTIGNQIMEPILKHQKLSKADSMEKSS